jgi:N utilization substance protein A
MEGGASMPARSFFSFISAGRAAATEAHGIDDALRNLPGVLASMLAAFGANGIRTVEDLAACATDDLLGWTEESGAGVTRHPGILGDDVLSRQDCDALILRARVRAGWIEAPALSA